MSTIDDDGMKGSSPADDSLADSMVRWERVRRRGVSVACCCDRRAAAPVERSIVAAWRRHPLMQGKANDCTQSNGGAM